MLKKNAGMLIVYNLSHLVDEYVTVYSDNILYTSIPRRFYRILARLLKWKHEEDLNTLVKLTHYIDEFMTVAKLTEYFINDDTKVVYVFGSMSLFSFLARIFKAKNILVYDPLANYAQTLYLLSRRSFKGLIKYGLYLALHKLQLRSSDYIIYPSKIDLENAKYMFNINNIFIIPNPIPICYKSVNEYIKLRSKRREFSKPYFVLMAGSRSNVNEKAVRTTIGIFNKIPFGKFKLLITGPWEDMRKYISNESIEILGIVPYNKLKEILAISDYGLAPIFDHVAGTFLKSLAYIAAGLNLITSPWGIAGMDASLLRDKQILIVRNTEEYERVIYTTLSKPKIRKSNELSTIAICEDTTSINVYLRRVLEALKNRRS